MIATKDSFEPHSSEQLPNSKRVYLPGKLHPDIRVPMREVELAPTSFNDTVEPNEPVRMYDCSGPWGDPNAPSEFPVPQFGEHDLVPSKNPEVWQPPKMVRTE